MQAAISILISIILSLFSTAVMSYISMAMPIGPWIAPTLVLSALLLYKICWFCKPTTERLALVTSAGSIGGILATACGFSFPTLYFIDQSLFNQWLSQPCFFSLALGVLALAGSLLGLALANILQYTFIEKEQYAFPIGQLIYKMIAASQQIRKAIELVIGFVSATFFSILQDGIGRFSGVIARAITLVPATSLGVISFPAIRLDLLPLLWAIGFVTGHVIAVPLFIGALSRIIVLDPINKWWFATLDSTEFVLAFCSGMVVSGALASFLINPKKLYNNVIKWFSKSHSNNEWLGQIKPFIYSLASSLTISILFFTYFKFSLLAQLFLIIGTILCAYQIIGIAGKIGLAPLGRFATFVMVPAMLIFKLDAVQIVFVATFVEICGGVAADILFSRKMAQMGSISYTRMNRFQLLGIVVSALSIGFIFWLLISHFGLGSDQLFAQKAQARALLINAKSFNYWVLLLGALFGYILKRFKINPALVLGGLLMPINMVIGLVVGGLATLLVKDKEEYFPFWSGVFAANSLWMLVQALWK